MDPPPPTSNVHMCPKGYEKYRSFRDTLYGKVRHAKHVETQTMVVIKEYVKDRVERRVTAAGLPIAEDAKEEIRLHVRLSLQRHPYIVQALDVQQDETMIYVVLEFCGKGELYGYLKHGESFRTDVAKHYFSQLMEGVHHMHSCGIAHRDLSLENVLLDANQVLKICDFGVAIECTLQTVVCDRVGKVKYMAPEVFAGQPYSPQCCDIWSCGVVLFVMIVGAFPYEMPVYSIDPQTGAMTGDRRFMAVYTGRISELLQLWGKRDSVPDEAVDLLTRIFTAPERRIGIDALMAHPFLQKHSSSSSSSSNNSSSSSSGSSSSSSSTGSTGSFSSTSSSCNTRATNNGNGDVVSFSSPGAGNSGMVEHKESEQLNNEFEHMDDDD